MTVGSTPSKSTIIRSLSARMSGNAAMQGQGGTMVRKLMSGANLTAAQQDIAQTTGLTKSVAQLLLAEETAQTAPAGPMKAVDYIKVAAQTRVVMNQAAAANQVYAQNHAGYAKAYNKYKNSALGKAAAKSQPMQDKFFNGVADAATVAGLGLSAWALPNFVKQTGSSVQQLEADFKNPQVSRNQELTDVGNLGKASSGAIYSAQGVVLGTKGVLGILSRNATMGSIISKVGDSPITKFVTSPLGKVLGVLLPVADAGVFVEDAVAERQTLEDPNATRSAKLMATLNLSLASMKLAFWVLPGVSWLKGLYSIASFAQLGLSIAGLWKQLKPSLIKTMKTIGWGIMHPIQGIHALGHAAIAGVDKLGAGLAWLGSRLLHPVQTFSGLFNGVATVLKGISLSFHKQPSTSQPATTPVPTTTTTSTASVPTAQPAVTAASAYPTQPVPAAAPTYTVAATAITQAPSTQAAYQAALSQINAGATQPATSAMAAPQANGYYQG